MHSARAASGILADPLRPLSQRLSKMLVATPPTRTGQVETVLFNLEEEEFALPSLCAPKTCTQALVDKYIK